MSGQLPPDYEDRPLDAARALSQILSYQLSEAGAEIVTLSRNEAVATLGLINAVIEVMDLGHAKPN